MRTVLVLTVSAVLSGCGGGGGLAEDASPNIDRPPLLEEPATGSSPSAWSGSDEYLNANGLSIIHAAEAYSVRTTGKPAGEDVRVAVIDTGIDQTHPDLEAQSFAFQGDVEGDRDGHGTHVAGTIAARRDGRGVHGVAYNADLVAIQAFRNVSDLGPNIDPIATFPSEAAASIASAAGLDRAYLAADIHGNLQFKGTPHGPVPLTRNSMPAADADIMNMSFGTPDPAVISGGGLTYSGYQVFSAMAEAAQAGKLMVVALGNESNFLGPSAAPASYVLDPLIVGHAVVVGALNGSGTAAASFSNHCAHTASYCIFAPGSGIYSTDLGGYGTMSGTSMAAPHVAGGLAVLMAAFPNQPPEQILNRLLTTADPLGASSIYGHGGMNLARAMNPVGTLSVPTGATSDGNLAPVELTSLHLAPGFDATALKAALNSVLTYDSQGFQFYSDLGSDVSGREQPSGLEAFVDALPSRTVRTPIADLGSVAFAVGESDVDIRRSEFFSPESADEIESFSVTLALDERTEFRLSDGMLGGPASHPAFAQVPDSVLPLQAAFAPYSSYVFGNTGAALSYRIDDSNVVQFGWQSGDNLEEGDATLGNLGMTHSILDGLALNWEAGFLSEDKSALGSAADGALGGGLESRTRYLSFSVNYDLATTVALFGSVTVGTSDINVGGSGLVSEWSDSAGRSFGVGASISEIFGEDRLVFVVSQPFKVDDSTITLRVPVSDDRKGAVHYREERVDVSPHGNETALQMVYSGGIEDLGLTYAAGSYARIEPNHDPDADTEFGLGVKLGVPF
ncbi:S8 family peptidase [Rhodospirillaceae bacterium SYSU D60014]|uniref:S8 family peptidase n=1 Tax=Virgifigura deserti TaxID=2268457 RepID=UPI0013C5268F